MGGVAAAAAAASCERCAAVNSCHHHCAASKAILPLRMRDAPQASLQPPAATGTVSIQASTSPKPAAWSTQHPATPWTARLVLSPRGRWTLGVKGVTTPAMLWHTLPAGGEDTCCSLPEPSGCRRGLGTYIHTPASAYTHLHSPLLCWQGKPAQHTAIWGEQPCAVLEAEGQGLISTPRAGYTQLHSMPATCHPPAPSPHTHPHPHPHEQGLPLTYKPCAPPGKSLPPQPTLPRP